jgi:hypothetical protein
MGSVTTAASDGAVNETGQWIATIATFVLAVAVIVAVVALCRRERIRWPLLLLPAGAITCLLEPLFDHLYGLWFPTEGMWILFTAYGVHEPVWLPAAYLVIYGGGAILTVRALQREASQRTVWRLYGLFAAVAFVGELAYIAVLGVYEYQGTQPFEVLGYPLYLGLVNAMSPLVCGLVIHRLLPLLHGPSRLALLALPPLAFAMDAFGGGFVYLAIRHSGEDPSTFLLYLGAITVALGTLGTVRLAAVGLPQTGGATRPAARPTQPPLPDPKPRRAAVLPSRSR